MDALKACEAFLEYPDFDVEYLIEVISMECEISKKELEALNLKEIINICKRIMANGCQPPER